MAERPLLFLDVDGVLNVPTLRKNQPHTILDGIRVWIPGETKERVSRLTGAFEPVWCTAWMGSAHRCWREVLSLSDDSWPYVAWTDLKLPALLRWAKERPWAWIDDEADWELEQLGWDRSMLNGLVITTDRRVGLTDADVEHLLGFAKESVS